MKRSAIKYLTHLGSDISNPQPPITNLEHPFAIIATDIAKGCSKSASGWSEPQK
jgi:hypothetical protein